ncbi:MAG TPA: hypothetical protein VGM18_13045 [Candidatus Sulfotelmatobacter sp.]
MSKLSVWQKTGVVVRVTRQVARRNRTLGAVKGAVRTVARSTGHVLHLLWLEVVGTMFLAMAAFGGIAGVREYLKYSAGHAPAGRVLIAICFTLTFGWFGVSSFWRVRRKSQRP